jgi:hypothetical protein
VSFLGGSDIGWSPSASTDEEVLDEVGLANESEIDRTHKVESKL